MHILLVDDEIHATNALKEFLEDDYIITIRNNGKEALDFLKQEKVDLVITDHNMPLMTGMELIKEGKKLFPDCFFVMVTAHSSLEHAIEALRTGADDYLLKPIDFTELEHRVLRIKQLNSWKNAKALKAQNLPAMSKMIGKSNALTEIKNFAQKVADAPTPVLITGQSGSGKELLAKAIHEVGKRGAQPFVAINCATLSEQLLESELFGHEKGSFTGATKSKPGKFELAYDGTLFLDEVGELAASLQAKLLRVLQEKEFYRLGGTRLLKTNCRIVAATHRDLETMVKNGEFREDLYFRLNVLRVSTPTLSQRAEDIPLLVEYFCKQIGTELSSVSQLDKDIYEHLSNKEYIGNIRELRNEVERMLVLNMNKPIICLNDLVKPVAKVKVNEIINSSADDLDYSLGLSNRLDDLEERLVLKAFTDNNYNQVKTAKALGITRGALQYKINKYNIDLKKMAA